MTVQIQDQDAALLAAAVAGDDRAFGALYRHHLPLVLRWLLRETADPELAADLAAEVFAAALVSLRRYDAERGSFAAWLLGIANNKLRESRRRHRVEASARRRLGFEPIELSDDDLERVEQLAGSEGEVLELLASLPEEQRDALSGRVLQGRPYAELAAQMRCSEMVVRKRVSRGLKTLRSRMEER